MRVALHDSCLPGDPSVTVGLDDDCSTDVDATTSWVDVSTYPSVTVRVRERTGYDYAGDPVFKWRVLVTDHAVLYSQRTEIDDVSGVTRVMANVVVLYAGDEKVTETARVEIAGDQYHVLSVAQHPDRIEFDMERVDGG